MAAIYLPGLKKRLNDTTAGAGYIGGDSPLGIVTISGLPTRRRIRVFHRNSAFCVGMTYSDPTTGTYRIDGLNPDEEFDVNMVETDQVEQDQIKGRVRPKPY